MKIHEAGQGSVEWMQARSGIPTASEFDALVTPKWKVKTGDGPKTYLAKKLAEWWLGGPLASFNTIFAASVVSNTTFVCLA
jgi:Na+/alanine symporter